MQELKEKHRQHPKVNAPVNAARLWIYDKTIVFSDPSCVDSQGSVDQLREVWEETDGLDPQEFNPKTFFKLHDTNEDGVLDEQELEALFTKEVGRSFTLR